MAGNWTLDTSRDLYWQVIGLLIVAAYGPQMAGNWTIDSSSLRTSNGR